MQWVHAYMHIYLSSYTDSTVVLLLIMFNEIAVIHTITDPTHTYIGNMRP